MDNNTFRKLHHYKRCLYCRKKLHNDSHYCNDNCARLYKQTKRYSNYLRKMHKCRYCKKIIPLDRVFCNEKCASNYYEKSKKV